MGWVNYIKIPRLKLLVEVPRNIRRDLVNYDNETIKEILQFADESIDDISPDLEQNYDNDSMLDMKIGDLITADFCVLIRAFRLLVQVPQTADEFFLYWLGGRGLSYEIISMYNDFITEKRYEREGYSILPINYGEEG